MPLKIKELDVVRENKSDLERIEACIKKAFLKFFYGPLMRELVGDDVTLQNARDDLLEAIRVGRVTYSEEDGGLFRGKFSATISKELRAIGATWDRKQRAYRLASKWKVYFRRPDDDGEWRLAGTRTTADGAAALATQLEKSHYKYTTKIKTEGGGALPYDLREAIAVSASRFEERLRRVDERLAKILPEEIAEKIKLTEIFDSTLYKADKNIRKTLGNISLLPEISPERRRQISEEWSTNLDLSIKNFTAEEIIRLRKSVLKSTEAGNRYSAMVSSIQRSYGVTASKAKFLARQETNLLLTKFKETRYVEAGVHEYRWGCVNGSPNHPVRPAHKALDGKIFRWNNPPITTEPNEPTRRNNPGQDFNCRCFARPIIRFKDET